MQTVTTYTVKTLTVNRLTVKEKRNNNTYRQTNGNQHYAMYIGIVCLGDFFPSYNFYICMTVRYTHGQET